MSDELLSLLLATPVGPTVQPREITPEEFTRRIEVAGDRVTATLNDEAGVVNTGTALAYLENEGLNPSEWEATGFIKSAWGEGKESTKFTFKRVARECEERLPIDDLLATIELYDPFVQQAIVTSPLGDYGFLVLIGDMQFGKIDGDGPAGTLARTIKAINLAADRLVEYSRRFHIGHVHIAWLGDHIEGFVSQGGANVFRTTLTLNEQIRLTRRVMLHALTTFAPLTTKLTMAAVPGNHGEAVRFMGKGVTRYDDSHDTESLIAVKDAADLSEKFGHVEFYVPHTDELIVMADVAGTKVAHHHGHSWRPGKQFEWWAKQSLNRESPLHMADLLVAGHLHHEHFETDGTRDYWGINALESESTWYRHTAGSGGSPGIHVGITRDGQTTVREAIKL